MLTIMRGSDPGEEAVAARRQGLVVGRCGGGLVGRTGSGVTGSFIGPGPGTDCCVVALAVAVSASWRAFAKRFSATASTRNTPNTTLVAQVSTSPVLEPKAVLPPDPPNALASPPPRPFWIRISRIMNRQTKMNSEIVV